MENKSHAMAAGTFVLVVTLMLLSLAWWLTRDTGRYQSWELSTRDGVTGLQPQAPVRYKGVAVGKVTHIGFDPLTPGNVLIRISVEEHAPLSPTTFATLAYQGVTGLAYVLLDDAGVAQADATPPGTPDGVRRLPLVTSQLGKLTEQAPELLARFNEATGRANEVMSDANQKRLSQALDQLGQAAKGLAQLAATADNTLKNRLDPALAAVPALAHDAGHTLKTLQGTATDISRMTAEVTTTARRLNEKDGAIDRLAQGTAALAHAADTFGAATLPRVNRVTEDTSRAARQLSRTVTGINDNPQSLIFGHGAVPPGPGEAGFSAPAALTHPAPARP